MARTIQQTLTTGAAGDTRLRQQRLPAWQPILDAKTVIPVFITISLLFIPVGIVLIITSNSVKEWAQYYDIACENQLKFGSNICIFDISLEEDFLGDVYFYYELENYYQNHRRYMRSRNDLQMLGRLDEVSDCSPFDYLDGRKIAPCGAIANSMFNDTFTLKEKYTGKTIEWSYEELIWPADRTKFINPKCSNGDCQTINDLCGVFQDEFAACFRAVRQEFNEETKTFELIHLFGCAPLEKGSNGSHLTCNAWRFAHSSPKSIFCCYEAADILSNVDSLTQMLLITDFHPLGSLYDYLRSNYSLNFEEALNLVLSIINGLEHLHNPVRGTGECQKLEIAHRDIKSKNILVKRPGVCCIADFGLAIVKKEENNFLKNNLVNIQVGTKEIIKTSNSFSNNNISTISTSLNEINNLKEHQHKLPFELIVETDPSFDQMREIVCDKKIRPPILNEWKKEENN
uniref:Protein kinase domain-containing protein n=1 Tax=Meloidogyne javanica TaxID=6303 RepID=A0A915MJG5_MELJA